MEVELTLPYPVGISVNHCWKRGRWGTYLDPRVKAYRNQVISICEHAFKFGKMRLSVHMQCYFPDKRRRDLDNILKVVLDSLARAGLFDDDSQIIDLRICYAGMVSGGRLDVKVMEKG